MPRKKKKKLSDIPEHHRIRQEQKRKRRKNVLASGPWSELVTNLEVKAKFVKHFFKHFNGSVLGIYYYCDDGDTGGGYRARVKITVDKWSQFVVKYGLDELLAACEKSLNEHIELLGCVVIIEAEDKGEYAECLIRTTKRNIKKFQGIKYGKLQVF